MEFIIIVPRLLRLSPLLLQTNDVGPGQNIPSDGITFALGWAI